MSWSGPNARRDKIFLRHRGARSFCTSFCDHSASPLLGIPCCNNGPCTPHTAWLYKQYFVASGAIQDQHFRGGIWAFMRVEICGLSTSHKIERYESRYPMLLRASQALSWSLLQTRRERGGTPSRRAHCIVERRIAPDREASQKQTVTQRRRGAAQRERGSTPPQRRRRAGGAGAAPPRACTRSRRVLSSHDARSLIL